MIYLLTEESGASSVMIVFLMLVLVTLGAYTISSARVNYAFSRKAFEWNRKYYECDTQAEEFLMDVDKALAKAERKTAEAAIWPNSSETQYGIHEITPVTAEIIFNNLYKHYLSEELALLSEQYDRMDVNEDLSTIGMIIQAGGKEQIGVKLTVLPLRYAFESIDGEIRGVLKEGGRRYSILEWRQAQMIGASATQEPLWNGEIE